LVKRGRAYVNNYARLKIEKLLTNFLKKMPKFIKKEIVDDEMCECVKSITEDMVDDIWPDVQEEILFHFRLQLNKPVLTYEEPPPRNTCCTICCFPCCAFRKCFVYNYQPVDRSFWKQIKTFWYWVIMFIQIIPFYAVQPLFKLLAWIMIDKRDEYQLVKFILDFKTLQFFTMGCLGGIINYLSYYVCVVFLGGKNRDGEEIHTCASRSPSHIYLFYLEVNY